MNTIRMMVRIKQHLITALFLLIVLIPAVILSFLAIRSVNQEEMVQRKRLEDTLLLELDRTNTILRLTIDNLIQELHESLPDISRQDITNSGSEEEIIRWKESEPLVGIPYLLVKDGSILYPDIRSSNTNEKKDADLFYWRYLNLFSNKESIPVYKNIAEEYEKEILDKDVSAEKIKLTEDKTNSSKNIIMESELISPRKEIQASDKNRIVLSKSSLSSMGKEAASSLSKDQDVSSNMESNVIRSKKALEIFESDAALQERIYSQAEEEGQQYLTRNLLPQITPSKRKENTQTVIRSVYIESTKYFNEIIDNADYGIIPRTFDSTFILLYWEKKGDIITGCEINMDVFNKKLIEATGKAENSFRFLNIIDRSGKPLIPLSNIESEKWRQPFVAKEISKLLPYWETAIILRNPEDFQKQIESSRYFMSLIVFVLCLLIFTGITAVYKVSSSRLKNVQRKVDFVTNVSHELKTPLTSIRMYSEMMAEGFQKDPEKIIKYSGYIASESQRLTRLINNVLDFAKLEKGTKIFNLETADINSLIKDIIPSLKEEFNKNGFIFKENLNKESLFVKCDKESVIQVLINLFSNVQKYSTDEKYIEIKTFQKDKQIIVSVTDKGTGIAKKYRKKIFRYFFRIDTSITSDSKGTGLGLAIAKKIMKQQGGDLIYTALKGDDYRQGSIFSMIFPSAEKKDI